MDLLTHIAYYTTIPVCGWRAFEIYAPNKFPSSQGIQMCWFTSRVYFEWKKNHFSMEADNDSNLFILHEFDRSGNVMTHKTNRMWNTQRGESHLIYRLEMRLIIKWPRCVYWTSKQTIRSPIDAIYSMQCFKCFAYQLAPCTLYTLQSCMSEFTPSKLVERKDNMLYLIITICHSLHKIIIPNRDLMWSKERVNSMIILHIVQTTAAAIAKQWITNYLIAYTFINLNWRKKWKWKIK